MNLQKITDDIIRQRLGSQPQYGMDSGGAKYDDGTLVRPMYSGGGPISLGINTATGKLKSWGRAAQPELPTEEPMFNTDIVGGIKRWDARQRGDVEQNIHSNINPPSIFKTESPVVGTKQVTTTPTILGQQATQTTRPDTNMSANEMTRIATAKTPQIGIQRQAPITTPEQDELSRQAAQDKLNAGYAASAAQQDLDRASLARQERIAGSDRMVKENIQSQQAATAEMNRPWWAGGTSDTANAGARQLGMLQAQGKQIGEFGQQVGALEGQRLANEGLPEQRRAGIVNEMKRLGLAEKELGIKEKQFGEEMGLKREDMGIRREDRASDREIKKLQLEQAKQQAVLSRIPYDEIMKLPPEQRAAAYSKFAGKKETPDAKVLENLDKITSLDDPQRLDLSRYYFDKGDMATARMLASMSNKPK